ncbi:MAG TPA: aminoacyl-tRNA hydrolase [Ignavibacteriaceae bacterium]|nr:aminoacyl-tRNA hydrolase [Ignavibacteriaceae bacterium]
MRAVLGIGNPGNKYKNNRHNAGFILLDYYSQKKSLSFKASKGDYYSATGKLGNSEFILIKPVTYVNLSGEAASDVLKKYNVQPDDFLVIVDDINLPVGEFRLRATGGDGGHNGMNSIIYHLYTEKFPRLRIGIGSNFAKGNMADYVLDDFTPEEIKTMEPMFKDLIWLIDEFIQGGVKKLMDANSRLRKEKGNLPL